MLYHPIGVAVVAVTVIVAVADVTDAESVGAAGENETVVPVGTLLWAATRVTGPVRPLVVATVIVNVADWPCSIERLAGAEPMVKSGLGEACRLDSTTAQEPSSRSSRASSR